MTGRGQEGAHGPASGGGAAQKDPNQGGPPGRSDGGSQGGLRAGVTSQQESVQGGWSRGQGKGRALRWKWGRCPELSGGRPDGRGCGRERAWQGWNLLEHLCLLSGSERNLNERQSLARWAEAQEAHGQGSSPWGHGQEAELGQQDRVQSGGPSASSLPLLAVLLARQSLGGPRAWTLPSSTMDPLED